jgi:ferredoxin
MIQDKPVKEGLIMKGEVVHWLRALVKEGKEVLVPVETDGKVGYEPLASVKDDKVLLEFTNSHRPPKGVVFPQCEVLLVYGTEKDKKDAAGKVGKGRMKVREVRPEMKETVIFAIRPCDARAVAILDKVFSGTDLDPYYWARREKVILVGLACAEPDINCFCTSVGGSPGGKEGLDVLLTGIGGGLYAEALTKKGADLMGSKAFEAPGAGVREKAGAAHRTAAEAFARVLKDGTVEPKAVAETLTGKYEDPYWDETAKRCIGCGACAFLCPTCHCFDINDEGTKRKGRRVRSWDTCQFPDFTLHTSGHNPRPMKKFRIRQRVYHKFKYMPDNIGVLGCVGCGRCISMCPMNMDIFKVLVDVKAWEAQAKKGAMP